MKDWFVNLRYHNKLILIQHISVIFKHPKTKKPNSHLCGVMVSMLAIGPKVPRFKPSQDDGLLGATKLHNTPIFVGELSRRPPS
jgi:hypothetical protein